MQVDYIDHMGTDDRVVDAARVSFNKIAANYLPEDNIKLLRYLARHNHWSPFAHPQITMRETVPIFVARQRFKHVQGFIYNEVSRRYVDDEPQFYVPDVWRGKPVNAKQGSDGELFKEHETLLWKMSDTPQYVSYQQLMETCRAVYQNMIEAGVAPEQARMVLPQSMYTSYYTTGSLAAWARAYKQRTDPHAQKEIQDLAVQWGEVIEPLFPESWKVLTDE